MGHNILQWVGDNLIPYNKMVMNGLLPDPGFSGKNILGKLVSEQSSNAIRIILLAI